MKDRELAYLFTLSLTVFSMTLLKGCTETNFRKEPTLSEPSHYAMDYKNHIRDIWYGRDTNTFHPLTKTPSK